MGNRGFWFVLALSLIAGTLGFLALRISSTRPKEEVRTSLSVAEVMGGGSTEGFARASKPRPFEFPEDHGPHPEFRTEWWYITGNLEGPEGRPFGFQFTIFRSALNPEPPSGESSWATNQIYMGHLALTDGGGETFRAYERFSRGAQDLAGARAEPFKVWLEDWVLAGPEDGLFPLRLEAGQEDRAISLVLRPLKPMVLQGDRGLSQKGSEPGNASFYYSFTRLDARGTVVVDDQEIPVEGRAWLDREWSTSALSSNQVGWDWFALQLSDGRDLMYYQLRLRDGSADPLSKGILVDREGSSRVLEAEEVDLQVLERWESPLGGATYPARWNLAIPAEGIDLDVVPLLVQQELNLTFRYWEGSVRVSGNAGSEPVRGRGYVELTGYAETQESAQDRAIGRGTTER